MFTRIYLIENCYGDPNKLYIGKEKSDQNKFNSREYRHRRTYGEKIIFTYIDEVEGWETKNWRSLEGFYINYFKFLGFEVLNKNNGGGGMSFCPEEVKVKISKGNKGKKVSNNTKNKMSISGQGKKKAEETKKKMSKAHLGKKHTQETCNKISKNRKGYKFSKESNINRSLKTKGKPKPKGFGEKISKTTIGKPKPYNFTPVLQYDKQDNFIKEWNSLKEVSEKLNLNFRAISDCCRGKHKTHKGFKWKYKNK